MNNQFTPGPWEKRRCDDETIAIIGNTQQQESGCAYRIAHIYETKEDESNANLIASAPELLKQLRSARLMLYAWKGSRPKEYGEHPELNHCILDIEYTLDKAEGRLND